MKIINLLLALALILASNFARAEDGVSRIKLDNVPLRDVIQNLARQSSLNFILDPNVPGSSFGPGRVAPSPKVTGEWTNETASSVLHKLLKAHNLILITNPVTTVARIAPAGSVVKPVDANLVSTNKGSVIPVVAVDSMSLSDALLQFGDAARLKISLEPEVSAPAFNGQGTVSFRWQGITARQALAALVDNYGLVLTENPETASARIGLKKK